MAEEAAEKPLKASGKDIDKASGRFLFVERLKREGREKEWFDTLRRIKDEEGLLFGQASPKAMRELGYESVEKERNMEKFRLRNLHKEAEQIEAEEQQQKFSEQVRVKDFEAAVATLPDTATAQSELDWIRSHPAMGRRARSKQKTQDIVLSIDDVLNPPHGKAPSKSAVYALQHWANQPTEFFKSLLSEQKKQTEDGGHSGQQRGGDAGLEEVENLLREISGGSITQGSAGNGRSESPADVLPDSDPAEIGLEAHGERADDGHGAASGEDEAEE